MEDLSFRQRLKSLRETKNMTQDDLAQLLGVTRNAVSAWETGKSYPTTDKLVRIADHFDVSLDHLMAKAKFNIKADVFYAVYAFYEGREITTGALMELILKMRGASREHLIEVLSAIKIDEFGNH